MCRLTYAVCALCNYPDLDILVTFYECNEFLALRRSNHVASLDRMCAGHDRVHDGDPDLWVPCGEFSKRRPVESGWTIMPPRNCLRWDPEEHELDCACAHGVVGAELGLGEIEHYLECHES